MKLYSYWRSTAAYRVRIALNLKGVEYEMEPVNLLKSAQTAPGYLEVNPQGLVPALDTGGQIITQSTAIIEYMEDCFAEPPLLPADPIERAKVRAACQTIACDIHPLNNLRVLQYLRNEISCDEQQVSDWYKCWIQKGFTSLESQVGSAGLYMFGDTITMADIYLVPQMYNARRFGCDLNPFPRLSEISMRLEEHPAFLAAAPEHQADAN